MRSPKLDALDALAGDWVLGDPSSPVGRTSFTWLEGGHFLVQRWTVDIPGAPDGIAILGEDAGTGGLVQHYFDSRGVARVYQMRLEDGTWSSGGTARISGSASGAGWARTGGRSAAPGRSRLTGRAGSMTSICCTRECPSRGGR
jgi:hypothetical protein